MSKTKKLTLHVSSVFTVPDLYQSADAKTIEQALTLGAILALTVPTTLAAAKDSEFADLLKRKEAEAEAKETALTAELHKIKLTMATTQKEITTLEKEHERILREETLTLKRDALETQRRVVQETKELTVQQTQKELATLREQNHLLELRRTQLEKDRTADLERERVSMKESMQIALASKQEQLAKTEEFVRTLQHSYTALTEEYRSLNDYVRRKIKPSSSQEKGADYETIFRDHLLRAYGAIPNFKIHSGSRSSTGHEADFITNFYNTSILWEVKDYSHKVPTAQIDKFLRDVRENKQVRIAVMLSRTTEITGKVSTGDRQFEFEEGVLYVYLSRFEFLGDANDLLQSLRPMMEVWKELGKDKASMADERLLHDLQRSVEEAHTRKTEWKTHKARLGEAVSWMADCVEKAEANVQSLLRRVKGVEATIEVPEELFRPLEDERSRETARAVVAVASLAPEHEIQIQELAKAVAVHLSISAATATDRIKAVLLHVNTPKGKPHTTKGFMLHSLSEV
jgi:hypothetical protein